MTRILTVLVTAWVALALPVGQLRWSAVVRACCCPDPDRCMCPHDEDPTPDSMSPCHATSESFVSPELASFETPTAFRASEPVRTIERLLLVTAEPHAPPAPRRPDAPS
ncbi:MAG: hypothetical protein WKG01_14785 [Kofleriaceae bacterium]